MSGRRRFLHGAVAMIVLGPVGAAAEQTHSARRIGWLELRTTPTAIPEQERTLFAVFRQGLRELGYVEGQNVVIETRFAERQGLAAAAAELVQSKVDVLVVNLRTARALGLRVPPSVLLRADRVIE